MFFISDLEVLCRNAWQKKESWLSERKARY